MWYRPPGSGLEGIRRFQQEWKQLSGEVVYSIIMGDMNVHSIRWLVHSARESAEGNLLREVSEEIGLQQKMTEPTRQQYLLDLVLTDAQDVTVSTTPYIADHKGVLCGIVAQIPENFKTKQSCGTLLQLIGR